MIIHMEQPGHPPAKSDEPASGVRVCAIDELPLGLGRAFRVGARTIAVFRTRGGKILAVDNRCPHRGGPLAEGMLAGDAVVCPLHAFRYDGITGACDQPGACGVEAFPVHLRAGDVYIALPPQASQKDCT